MKLILLILLMFTFANILFAQETGGPYSHDENTVLLMHFDADAINSANVGNNGIIHGSGITYESGIHGQALRLNNSTADKQLWIEVSFYDELNFSNEFSVECWFKINSWGDEHTKYPVILRKGDNWDEDYGISLNSNNASLGTAGIYNANCRHEKVFQL